jgi:hypothetical protein
VRNSWIILAFIALFSFSSMSVILTFLVRKGVPLIFVLFILFVTVSAIYGVQILRTGAAIGTISSNFWLLLLAASVLSAVGNLAVVRANAISPNPGLVTTIVGLQAGMTAVLAFKFLNNNLNSVQIAGLLVGILAVIIIAVGSRSGTKLAPSRTATLKNVSSSGLDVR